MWIGADRIEFFCFIDRQFIPVLQKNFWFYSYMNVYLCIEVHWFFVSSKDAAKAVTQRKGRVGRANSGHSSASLNLPGVGISTGDHANEQDEEVT